MYVRELRVGRCHVSAHGHREGEATTGAVTAWSRRDVPAHGAERGSRVVLERSHAGGGAAGDLWWFVLLRVSDGPRSSRRFDEPRKDGVTGPRGVAVRGRGGGSGESDGRRQGQDASRRPTSLSRRREADVSVRVRLRNRQSRLPGRRRSPSLLRRPRTERRQGFRRERRRNGRLRFFEKPRLDRRPSGLSAAAAIRRRSRRRRRLDPRRLPLRRRQDQTHGHLPLLRWWCGPLRRPHRTRRGFARILEGRPPGLLAPGTLQHAQLPHHGGPPRQGHAISSSSSSQLSS
mmetsp:Transcript_28024/g.90344  ORF Transcript_28024/g.90344 Transcript_28024/m.90344 type:complete len:289 (+) Transcript_28024:190-1056(+)